MTQEREQSENGMGKLPKKGLPLLLLGLGAFQIIAALLALLLWLAGISWQSYVVPIAALSVVLTTSFVFFMRHIRS